MQSCDPIRDPNQEVCVNSSALSNPQALLIFYQLFSIAGNTVSAGLGLGLGLQAAFACRASRGFFSSGIIAPLFIYFFIFLLWP